MKINFKTTIYLLLTTFAFLNAELVCAKSAGEKLDSAIEKTEDKAKEYSDKVKETAHDAKEKIKDKAHEVKEKIKEKVNES